MSDLSAFREMLDRSELSHMVQYVGTDHIENRANIAIHAELANNEKFNIVIEFDPEGNFVMFDLEENMP